MDPWIPITIFAAFCQNLRSALQRRLAEALSPEAASYVRFCFALPFVAFGVLALAWPGASALPSANAGFLAFVAIASLAQALATVALIRSFGLRNFAVGTAYSKTETVQTAAFGFVIAGEGVSALAAAGIAVSLGGVLLLSVRNRLRDVLAPGRGAWLGIAAGGGFGIAAVCYREAALALPSGEFFVRAAVTLLAATLMQTTGMGAWLAVRQPGALMQAARAWRTAIWVGLTGAAASAAWFSAMALERAAYVRALGQIELLFAFAAAAFFLRERVRKREALGAALVAAGLILIVL